MSLTFKDLYHNRHEIAKEYKAMGKTLLGYLCGHVPEEIISAAGIIPLQIRGSMENITEANSHLEKFVCSFARSCLDQALKGRYDYLDGVVFPKSCDTIRDLYSIWVRNINPRYFFYLALPSKKTERAREYYIKELIRFKKSLEESCGRQIQEGDLKRAISIYNENRSLLKRLYELRKVKESPLSGTEFFNILRAGFVIPKERHNQMIQQFLINLPEKRGSIEDKVRLLVSGNTFENDGILALAEELGGEVVGDDLCVGTRYFWHEVVPNGDLVGAIAERYLGKIPCPCRHPSGEERLEGILRDVEGYRVKGVIFIIQKFCDTHLYETPFIVEALSKKNIPVLSLEVDDTVSGDAQLKTRLQAFMEMLRQRG